jgi:ribulose-bisphosphate carboxylase large chain
MEEIIATYRIESRKHLADAAEEICKEESVGTWTDLSTLKAETQQRLGAKIVDLNEKEKTVKIAYSLEEYSHEPGGIPQLLSFVAGNLFGMSSLRNVRLVDIDIPQTILDLYLGPKFGIGGIKSLIGVRNRPILGTIIKPKLGLTPLEQAKVFKEAAVGGVDFGKDDENLVNQSFCPLLERAREIANVIDQVKDETGRKVYYAINVTTRADKIVETGERAIEEGATCLMADVVCGGIASVQALAEDPSINVPIHVHRAGHASFTRNPKHGISMLVLAKLVRLSGGDQLHTGTVVGKMEAKKNEVKEVNDFFKRKWGGIKTVYPVASGGMHPLLVPKLLEIEEKDIIIQAGGGIHGHPDGTMAGARAMKQAIDAVLSKIPLTEYAKEHRELKRAIDKWG